MELRFIFGSWGVEEGIRDYNWHLTEKGDESRDESSSDVIYL